MALNRFSDLPPSTPHPVAADTITIAVTVFNRREFILQAIASALRQTLPVRVLVVEDCSPDADLETMVRREFGDRIQYHRNTERRGLFGNWNACLELCTTPWLSILHDDDYLAPDFIEAMQELAHPLPNLGIYFSSVVEVSEAGEPVLPASPAIHERFRRIDPRSLAFKNDVLFPGQLLRVKYARSVGGFRQNSQFCGDWEMWFKLAYHYGAAQTSRQLAFSRSHRGLERGTNKVVVRGRKHALDFVQVKRNLAQLRQTESGARFDRRQLLKNSPLPAGLLIRNAQYMSSRLLDYNRKLLLLSTAPHWRYRIFQAFARLCGPHFMRVVSKLLTTPTKQTHIEQDYA
ncbi:MAG: hypothetical protein DLM52_11635 [Chthoniobacterales bacterium]|nr:MAG: hypothetical protein DLM52_11635 [Chthoniobacterales bacterium]